MEPSADQVSMADIARLAGVKSSAVTNWRQRHDQTFPQAHRREGQEFFPASEISAWLDQRKIARNDLQDAELPGTTYGMRFRRNLGTHQTPTDALLFDLWHELRRYRGSADTQLYGDLLLGLLYLCAQDPPRWAQLISVAKGQWDQRVTRQILARAMETHGLHLPNLESLTETMTGTPGRQEPLSAAIQTIEQFRHSMTSGGALPARDWAGQAFEYLLTQLAASEGKRGAEFFTPPSVVRVLVELLAPKPGDTVHDPCCGSGSMLVAAAESVIEHDAQPTGLSLSGRALSGRSWVLARMNTELNGRRADLGSRPTLALREGLTGQRFDVLLTNPPFNMTGWSDGDPARDPRWPYGPPPEHTANFAWLQHSILSLSERGTAAVVMANSASSSENSREKTIRASMVEDGTVAALIALPPQLFYTTTIPVTIWLLRSGVAREANNDILFIDATSFGTMVDRSHRILTPKDILKIADTYHAWNGRTQGNSDFGDSPGFSASVSVQDIRDHDYRLNPRIYISQSAGITEVPEAAFGLRRTLQQLEAQAAQIDAWAEHQMARIGPWIR